MENEEVIEKIENIKTSIKDLYDAGVIKPTEYNDIWAKINNIKVNIKCNLEE
jgi:ribonuclease HIII